MDTGAIITNNMITEEFIIEWYKIRSHTVMFGVSDFESWLRVHYPHKAGFSSIMLLNYTKAGERLSQPATDKYGNLRRGFRPRYVLGCTGLGPYAKHFPMGAGDARESVQRQVREKSDAILADMKRRAAPAALANPQVLATVKIIKRGIETRFEEIASLLQIV
jgi:hypothetical protein